MQELNLKLRVAEASDLELVSALASQIWKSHYTPIIGEAQVQYMLGEIYSQKSLLMQVEEKHHVFYMISLNEETIGFISVHHEGENKWFLNKFYILGRNSARGFGSLALAELKKIIQPLKLTLTVNRQNYKSINFYFKNGFTIERVADFDIGKGYVMNDFVMVWQIAANDV